MSDQAPLSDRLTPEQKAILSSLSASVSYEGMTISFSLDGKDLYTGVRKSAFFSLKVSRGDGQDGWSTGDSRVVRCLLSKEVVTAVYDDAVRRRMLEASEAREQLRPILASYDNQLVKLLGGSSD